MVLHGRAGGRGRLASEDRRLVAVGTGILILLLGWLLAGPYGLWQLYDVHRQRAQVTAQIEDSSRAVAELSQELEKLENDPAFLEQIARNRFGLVRPNEVVYDFSKTSRKK
ncbi:MAG: septum formation initiator family protein [Thermodesulfobacteriota bacterium]